MENVDHQSADAGTRSPGAGRSATSGLALSMLLASLGTSIANIALPALAAAFTAPFFEVQAVVVAYLAALAVSVFLAGYLGDRYGLKCTLLWGLVVFAAGSLLCGLAPSLGWLIGARALQGAGAAFLMTLSMALVRDTVGEARSGKAMGLLATMSGVGTALGPSLGGALIQNGGWRSLFLVQVPGALLAFLLLRRPIKAESVRRKGSPPSIDAASREHEILAPLVLNGLVAAVMMTTLIVGPLYLGRGLGLTEMQMGLVMTAGPLISIFGGIPSGHLVDVWGSRRVMATGLGLLAGGAGLLSVSAGWAGVPGYLLGIAVLTPGYQLFQAANNTATLAGVPAIRRGRVSGLLGLSRNVGLIAGASVMGKLFSLGAGEVDLMHATPVSMADGMRLTFGVAGVLMLAAIGVAEAGSRAAGTDLRSPRSKS